jgi:hypothetical protein
MVFVKRTVKLPVEILMRLKFFLLNQILIEENLPFFYFEFFSGTSYDKLNAKANVKIAIHIITV